ncbi:uncharacterized protein LOC129227747 [Uloborus diversus]|uniref:uncharacterized protein LOC129227747 n=1 Tax=Uloborus diversus TaxID=327109 RepID=UPI002409837E|nr:uncharacterized protein LOC129227747 [Uloborus diversus]
MMPIHFYPQGVLINVDLSHLNEIPPLILIEVDRMLKTYMSSGDININLLKKRLNATTEGMKDPQHTTQENEMKDITNMIHLIGNMLSTSTEEPHSTAANNTDINDFSTTVRTEGNVHVKEIEYENVTEPNQDNKTDISHTTDSEEEIKKKKLANEKIVRNEQEELKAPFARRRLYRKYKYPSIREQIRKQNLHRYDLNNNHYFPTVIKAYNLPKVPAVSNRHRYPSIAEQLRRQMIEITSNERPSNLENLTIEDEPNTGRTELSDDKDLQFGDRIKIINPEISNQIHNHPNLPESQPDSNFGQLGNTANFPKIQAGKVFRTANENIDFDDEIDDNYQSSPARKPIINSIPQSQVPRSNLFYTLPILPSNNVHEPRANTYRGRYSAESSLPQEENVVRYRDNLSNFGRQQIQHNEQPAKRRRKLRILVKKRVDPNTLDNTDTTYPHSRHTERHLPPTRLPNNLLKVLKRKLKQRMNIDSENDVALQIQFQDYVWNVPFVNNQTDTAFSSTACTRPGLFQHPTDCNMFYECFWDRWLQKFTLHVFSCPVRLIYDDSVRGCSHPSIQSYCTDGARK